ncbi:MAG: SBBP repeat-containing protein, partial [Chitinophagales bacterium]|nr:SBBP repeat-containing protein [Chitinophagales bacterium]
MKIFTLSKLLLIALAFYYATQASAADVPVTYLSSQIKFIENKGQQPAQVLYNAKVPGGNIYLEKNIFTYYIFSGDDLKKIHPLREDSVIIHGHVWKEIFMGANPNPTTTAVNPSTYTLNYFIGNNQAHWATNVHDYSQVSYKDLYNGVDMNVYAFGPNLKYDLIVQPNIDPSVIQIQFEGAESVSIQNNSLVIGTSIGNFTEQKPYSYQIINGVRKTVSSKFILIGKTVSFKITGRYNHDLPLIIDPTLIFASYTGSTADNFGYTATYDGTGAMLLGGLVHSDGYPVTIGAVQFTYGGGSNIIGNGYACDMGIMKLSAMGNALLWATYLGGSSNETPHSMVVDQNDNLCVYGRTWSDDFATTTNAYDKTYNGDGDIVVAKISSNGNTLLGSTYLGGSDEDGVNINATEPGNGSIKVNYGDDARGEIITDNIGNIYVATCTKSTDFPVTSSALQSSNGGNQDGCVFKFNTDVSSLQWSTYLGGSGDDACYSLDVFNSELYVSGGTASSNFPATAGSLHPTFQGGATDGFVSHISADGTTLLQSSFIGTSGDDQSYFVKLDASSNAYLYGQTSGAYPVTANVYTNPNSGQFIHKLDPTLSSTIYSTVFGNGSGKPNISPTAFLVDTCENIYISGWGGSVFSQWSWFNKDMHNMPITLDALQTTTDGNDFYIAVFKKNMASLAYATYYGGNTAPDVATEHVDGGTSRFDKNGVIYQAICAGCGGNSTTPTTPGAWSETNNSFNCNELGLKLEVNLFVVSAALEAFPTVTGCVPLTVQFTNNSLNATVFEWFFGDGGSSSLENPIHTFTDTGTFQIMLIASDPTACVPKDTAYTTVVVYNTKVDGNFLYQIIDLCDSVQINLQGNSSSISTTYTWDFGDGAFA